MAAFGLTFISDFLIARRSAFLFGASVFLLWLGARMFRARPGRMPTAVHASGLAQACGVTLVLTLANPMTILSFLAIFAARPFPFTGTGGLTSLFPSYSPPFVWLVKFLLFKLVSSNLAWLS